MGRADQLPALAACVTVALLLGGCGGGGGGGGSAPPTTVDVAVRVHNPAPVDLVSVSSRPNGSLAYDPPVAVSIAADGTQEVLHLLSGVFDFRVTWADGTTDDRLAQDLYGLAGSTFTLEPTYSPSPPQAQWVQEDTSLLQWGAVTGFAVRSGVLAAAGWVTPHSNEALDNPETGHLYRRAPAIWERSSGGWIERSSEAFDSTDYWVGTQIMCLKPATSSVRGIVAPYRCGDYAGTAKWGSAMLRTWDGVSSTRFAVPLQADYPSLEFFPVLGGSGALADGSVIVPWFNEKARVGAYSAGGILRWDPAADSWTREWGTTAWKAPLCAGRSGDWVAGIVPGDTTQVLLLQRNADGSWTEHPSLNVGGPGNGTAYSWYSNQAAQEYPAWAPDYVGRIERSAQGRVMVVGTARSSGDYSSRRAFALERAAGSTTWLLTSLPQQVVHLHDVAFEGETAWAVGEAYVGSLYLGNLRPILLRRDPGDSSAWEEVTVPPAPSWGMWIAVEVVQGTIWLGGWRFSSSSAYPDNSYPPVIVRRGLASGGGTGSGADDHANSASSGTSIQAPSTTSGTIEVGGDVDWLRLPVTAGRTYTIKTTLGTLRDSVLAVYSGDGVTLLASNDDEPGGGLWSWVQYTPTSSTTLAIRVAAFSATGTGTYSLVVQ